MRSNRLQINEFRKKPSFSGGSNFYGRRHLRSYTLGTSNSRNNPYRRSRSIRKDVTIKLFKFMDRLSKYLNLAHLVLLMRMALVDFMIPIMINLYFLHNFRFASGLNWIFCITVMSIYSILLYYGWMVMKSVDKPFLNRAKDDIASLSAQELKKLMRFKNWMTSRHNLKEDLDLPYKYLPELIGVGEIICCVTLVVFYKHFLLQILPIMILKGGLFIIHLKKKDLYDSKLEYWANIINEFLLFFVSILFLVYHFAHKGVTA